MTEMGELSIPDGVNYPIQTTQYWYLTTTIVMWGKPISFYKI